MKKLAIADATASDIHIMKLYNCIFEGQANSDSKSPCIFSVHNKTMTKVKATFGNRILTGRYWKKYLKHYK